MPIAEGWCAGGGRNCSAAGLRLSRLTDLDQVAVGVPDVGTDFAPVIFRLGKELHALGRPFRVDPGDIRHTNVEEPARAVGVASVTVGLSSVGPPPTLRISHEFATFMMTGSRSRTTLPPSSD